jgi:endonuclease/exonuclease/phosphatase family metal-dependent hydrolase
VKIITWNANRVNRWTMLWADRSVRDWDWDVICLQEAGNPLENQWTRVAGPPWDESLKHKTAIFRYYTYHPYNDHKEVSIMHGEWIDKQKNHLVMIIKGSTPALAFNLSGDEGFSTRPYMGIKVRLQRGTQYIWVLLGCVHVVASGKAAVEVSESMRFVVQMVDLKQAAGYLLFGDFNSSPGNIASAIKYGQQPWQSPFGGKAGTTHYPGGTHDKGETLDYAAYSDHQLLPDLMTPDIWNWDRSTTKSDHYLMSFYDTALWVSEFELIQV